MDRNTRTTVKELQIGDRFYKAKDAKNKKILQMVAGEKKKTHFQTYNYWCKSDTEKHFQAINGSTEVIFLRNANEHTQQQHTTGTVPG